MDYQDYLRSEKTHFLWCPKMRRRLAKEKKARLSTM